MCSLFSHLYLKLYHHKRCLPNSGKTSNWQCSHPFLALKFISFVNPPFQIFEILITNFWGVWRDRAFSSPHINHKFHLIQVDLLLYQTSHKCPYIENGLESVAIPENPFEEKFMKPIASEPEFRTTSCHRSFVPTPESPLL